ncbi:MAG: hypothetical protein ACTHJP_11915 [Rhodanobacteraceae bacterium]
MGIIKELVGASAPRGGFRRNFRATLYGCAAGALLLGTTQAVAGTVVTDTVFSQSTQGQNNVPVTFGQVFKAGDVPSGATLAATLNGQPVTLQVNPKATNPDGSLRHAVLTAMVPSLPAGAKLPLTLYTGTALTGPTIGLSQLLATGYDAKISLNIGGTVYTASARSLLQAANLAGACAAWDPQCNVWLSGPLASEWVVNGPVTASNGSSPNLRVYFAVRAYSNGTPGTVGRVRTDIIVENSDAFAPQSQPQYTATLTSGSASYSSPALTQYTATRWHKVLWWNNTEPQVYLQQDTQYIQNSLAVSRYQPLTPSESFLASLRQSCAPLDNCDQTKTMSNVGAQPAIGPLPRWTSVYIVDPDVRAYNWMLANTDALGAYSIHYRDEATGFPLSIQRHPYVTIADWAYASSAAQQSSAKGALYKADLLPGCVNNTVVTGCTTAWYGTGNPNKWDAEHQPAQSYVPYMVTGDYFYMSELAFSASLNELFPNETYRGFSQLLIENTYNSVRAKAWALRNVAEAAFLLPDGYPLKAEFNAAVNDSLAYWNQKYSNNPSANPLRVTEGSTVYSVNGGKNNGVAPWQHDFLTWSAGHAAELGFSGAAQFRDWLAGFEIGLMTDWQNNPTQGYCWLQASGYAIVAKDAYGHWLPSFSAAYQATFPTLSGLACNSPAMVDAMGKLEGQVWQAGEMHGYPYAATGFPANFQIGIAAAADTGLPNAQTAWSIFESRSVKPSGSNAYNNYPNFAVIPRTVQAGPVQPPTMPSILDPPPTSSPPPTTPPSATPPPVPVTPPQTPTMPPVTAKPPTTIPAPRPVTTLPPVPKELPARQCVGRTCTGAVLPGVSSAEPVRTSGVNSKVINPAATVPTAESAAPASAVRFLVNVVCTRLNARWCMRYLPRRLYVPAQESARPQPIVSAAVPARSTASAVPVAPGLSPSVPAKHPTMQGDGRLMRR